MAIVPFWVDFPPFRPLFKEICQKFGFEMELEIEARNFLYHYLHHSDPQGLVEEITHSANRKIICFIGAGPNLVSHIQKIRQMWNAQRDRFYLVAADGSANALIRIDLYPDLVISDFDGLSVQQMQFLLQKGAILCLLAHGDNYTHIEGYQSLLSSDLRVIGTTQAPAMYPIINPGGFTDGDRGLFLMHHLLQLDQPFFLFGYAFEGPIGAYSKPNFDQDMPLTPFKNKKLQVCEHLLHLLSSRWHRQILFFDEDEVEQKIRWLIFSS
ncbi:MAG: hypothetical protein DRO88_01230 [Promethearchaeia archaeon]|nr:MAG: hypothetical protein DRO88_01230 [Candidatus Lokiarchaeia archaeon]